MQNKAAIKRVLAQMLIILMLFSLMGNVFAENWEIDTQNINSDAYSPSSVENSTYGSAVQHIPPAYKQSQVNMPVDLNIINGTVNGSVYNDLTHSYIVKFKSLDAKKRMKNEFISKRNQVHIRQEYEHFPFVLADLTDDQMVQLSQNSEISYIEKNKKAVLLNSVNTVVEDTYEEKSWGYDFLHADELHENNNYGQGIKIAVLDTGIDSLNNDLHVTGGVSFPSGSYEDVQGHGTKVAGIIASQINKIGIKGIAPSSELYAVKVLGDKGEGYYSQIISGIDWAIDNHMNIINMSFGGLEESQALSEALQQAWQAGILLISAAGNDGINTLRYPANSETVLSVGSINQDLSVSSFTNYGERLELLAPGTDILTTSVGNSYVKVWGTSASSAFVAGAAALVWSAHPTWTNEQVRLALLQSADSNQSDKVNGFGLVNIASAIKEQYNKTVQFDVYGVQLPLNSNGFVGITSDVTPPSTSINITGSSMGSGIYYGTVQIQFTAVDDLSGVQKTEYSLDGGASWNLYSGPITLTVPKVYSLKYKSTDNSNNVETIKSQKITIKGDTTPPTTVLSIISGVKGGGGFYTSPVVFQLTASDDSGIRATEYSIDGGANWINYNGPVTLDNNKTVSLIYHSVDTNNNIESNKITKIYIDRISPLQSIIEFSPSTWTNGDVVVTIKNGFDDGSGAQKSQYRLNNTDPWTDYIAPFIVTSTSFVYARTIDVAGNISIEVSRQPQIDKTPPTVPQIIMSESNWTKNNVTVQIIAGTDQESHVLKSQIRISETGNWSDYSSPILVSSEGETTIYARSIDIAGNISTEAKVTVYIDKTSPTQPTINLSSNDWSNTDVSFTIIEGMDNGSGIKNTQYKVGNDGIWVNYTSPVTVTTEGKTEIFAHSIDNAGNISSEARALILIDKTAPSKPVINLSESNWTNKDVNVSITPGIDKLSGVQKTQYRFKVDESWKDYINPMTFSNEGILDIFARSLDNAGNISEESHSVIKIDKTVPSTPNGVNVTNRATNTISIAWTPSTDNLSGVETYIVYVDSKEVGSTANSRFIVGNLTPGTTYNIQLKAKDRASNFSEISDNYTIFTTPLLSSFGDHGLLTQSNGVLWTWGNNSSGQLGEVNKRNLTSPIVSDNIENLKSMSAGEKRSLFIKKDGSVWEMGNVTAEGLGVIGPVDGKVPNKVASVTNAVYVSSGYDHDLALTDSGEVWSWGNNASGKLGIGINDTPYNRIHSPSKVKDLNSVISISAGYCHSIALKSNGTIWSWGCNGGWQLGDGKYTEYGFTDFDDHMYYSDMSNLDATGSTTPIQVVNLNSIVAISAGGSYSLALDSDGSIWSWGINGNGELGNGLPMTYQIHKYTAPVKRSTPTKVLVNGRFIAISAGRSNALALREDGTVWGWGYGIGNVPQQIQGLDSINAVFAGKETNFVIKNDGKIYSWGKNESGQLGLGYVSTNETLPKEINFYVIPQLQLKPAVEITSLIGTELEPWYYNSTPTVTWVQTDSSNSDFTGYQLQVLDQNNTVLFDTGIVNENSNSNIKKLALNNLVKDIKLKVRVKASVGTVWSDWSSPKWFVLSQYPQGSMVKAGDNHSLMLKDDGTVWAWGNNMYGQIGDGTTVTKSTPVQVANLSNVRAISTLGYGNHSLALKYDGTVWAWGANYSGQLGDGTTTNRLTAVQVPNLTNVVAISAGVGHSLALKSDGTLWAWGIGNGSGSSTNSLSPIQKQINGVKDISAGNQFSLVLKNDGTIWAWGINNYMQLGDTTTTNRMNPVQVVGLNGIVQIAASARDGLGSLAVKQDGTVWTWGGVSNALVKQVNGLTDIKQVAASSHYVALKSDGTLWTWGNNASGQLGNSTNINNNNPVQLTSISDVNNMSAGSDHTLAMRNDGSVWAWGDNNGRQLGLGTTTNVYLPRAVMSEKIPVVTLTSPFGTQQSPSILIGTKPEISWNQIAKALASFASYQVQVLDEAGTTVILDSGIATQNTNSTSNSWTAMSELPVNQKLRVRVKASDGTTWSVWSDEGWMMLRTSVSNVPMVAAGSTHSLQLKSDGTVWSWGSNNSGELGDGTFVSKSTAVNIIGLSGVSRIAAGTSHSIALKNDGTVWAWGANDKGQLGNGNAAKQPTPVQVPGLSSIINVAAGSNYSIALKSDGTVWAWGANELGQLGDGSTVISRYKPAPVLGLAGISAIDAGNAHNLAIQNDGSVWGWGDNQVKQVGNLPRDIVATPVKILTNVTEVSAGASHSLALLKDGRVAAWGANNFGTLGNGNNNRYPDGNLVPGLNQISHVSAGGNVSFAVNNNGAVWAWGYNYSGNLGDGTNIDRFSPVQLTTISGVENVVAGMSHSLALKTDGSLWAWGSNNYGQLGYVTPNGWSRTPLKVR
ncbi:S8 family serine peptidase [Paenibacillus sp. SYP-B3998]|uniref:S8 family serine peptidase n=1 Tax=Paenibacillus sp. SYP-B3998 TaxID=2678564 RepID=A0A6G4A5Q0_9BACL|nr:S8 family serine peptidase [Paenibacillus sp. SYP-B3998]NEW09151.1 S8 family serine peptidase [Paenibacillus sp. SYP-B3998]